MGKNERRYIFHLYRTDGQSLILHPFANSDRLRSALETQEIEGRYGAEPPVALLTSFRNDLYRNVEVAVRRFLSDARFVPRFLISAGAFFASFMILSYAVPDPILIVDELLVAVAAGIGAYLFLGRRDMGSDAAMKKRIALRNAVDQIKFVPSAFLARVEQELQRTESGNFEEAVRSILEPNGGSEQAKPQVAAEDRAEAAQFVQLLEEKYRFKRLRREEKVLRSYASRAASDRGDSLRRWSDTKKLDLPLYAVYKRFKRTVERV